MESSPKDPGPHTLHTKCMYGPGTGQNVLVWTRESMESSRKGIGPHGKAIMCHVTRAKIPRRSSMMSTVFLLPLQWPCTGHQRRCGTKNKPSSIPSHQILKDQLIQINTRLWTISRYHQFGSTQQDEVGSPVAPCFVLKLWLGYWEDASLAPFSHGHCNPDNTRISSFIWAG